jgi:hypothetical protein
LAFLDGFFRRHRAKCRLTPFGISSANWENFFAFKPSGMQRWVVGIVWNPWTSALEHFCCKSTKLQK